METATRDLGVDFHSDRFTVDFFEGMHHRKATYPLEKREDFYELLRTTDTVTIEVLTGTFAFTREFQDKIGKLNIVNPGKFNLGTTQCNKTDGIDARLLAEAGRMSRYHLDDKLAKVHLVSQRISEMRSLVSGYKMIVKETTEWKNRIHSILKENLYPFNGEDIGCKKTRKKIENLPLAGGYKAQIASFFRMLDFAQAEKGSIAETLKGYAQYFEREVKLLISIPGVSIFIAMVIVADYGGELERFKNAKCFCSYLGTAPRIEESNRITKIMHVNRASRKYALGLLLQGLQHTWKKKGRIKDFRDRKKSERMHNGKLRMAIARKTMTSIYYMLKNNECYYDIDPINYARKIEELKKHL